MAPARQRFGLLGGGDKTGLPRVYLQAEFIEFTGNTVIRISVPVNNDLGLYFDYEKTLPIATNDFPISWQRSNPYRAFRLVCGETSGGFNWWGTKLAYKTPAGYRALWQANFKNNRTISVNSAEYGYAEKSLPDIDCNYDEVAFGRLWVLDSKLLGESAYFKSYSIKLSSGSKVVNDLIPALDTTGTPCMYDNVNKKPLYNSGTGQFIVGMTLDQARKLSKLPAGGGELTVSLPWEAQLVQHNGQVETALETARGKGWLLKVQYRAPEAESAVYNKYAACTNTADVQAVNADYKTDLTADGEWVYPLPKFKTSTLAMFKNKQMKAFLVDLPLLEDTYFMLHETGLERYDGDLSSLIRGEGLFHNCFSFILFNGVLKVLKNGNHMFNSTKMTSFGADLSVLERGEYMFHMVPLTEFLSELPKLSMADFMFSRSMFDKDSTLRIFNSLPTWASGTHKITIGIHIDNQTDDEVLAAIANAEAKGWTLTVAWNGTPTAHAASTFGLRRPTIYAKSSNMELPDGTSERVLDWGHYVTNWEENGYLEFASVEEAEEYFGIEKEAER